MSFNVFYLGNYLYSYFDWPSFDYTPRISQESISYLICLSIYVHTGCVSLSEELSSGWIYGVYTVGPTPPLSTLLYSTLLYSTLLLTGNIIAFLLYVASIASPSFPKNPPYKHRGVSLSLKSWCPHACSRVYPIPNN